MTFTGCRSFQMQSVEDLCLCSILQDLYWVLTECSCGPSAIAGLLVWVGRKEWTLSGSAVAILWFCPLDGQVSWILYYLPCSAQVTNECHVFDRKLSSRKAKINVTCLRGVWRFLINVLIRGLNELTAAMYSLTCRSQPNITSAFELTSQAGINGNWLSLFHILQFVLYNFDNLATFQYHYRATLC